MFLVAKITKEIFTILPSGIIGKGVGTLLDLGKAVRYHRWPIKAMLEYQGWDGKKTIHIIMWVFPKLVYWSGGFQNNRAVRREKSLEFNSGYTTFDQLCC